ESSISKGPPHSFISGESKSLPAAASVAGGPAPCKLSIDPFAIISELPGDLQSAPWQTTCLQCFKLRGYTDVTVGSPFGGADAAHTGRMGAGRGAAQADLGRHSPAAFRDRGPRQMAQGPGDRHPQDHVGGAAPRRGVHRRGDPAGAAPKVPGGV